MDTIEKTKIGNEEFNDLKKIILHLRQTRRNHIFSHRR